MEGGGTHGGGSHGGQSHGGGAVIPVYAAGAANKNHPPPSHHGAAQQNKKFLDGYDNICLSSHASFLVNIGSAK
ncbi:hypothetical protein P8452_10904 [Trifolium repens]|nr:hypothetical protein P8452_10904 [Trifolium repens]